jgi:hypothetical protein
MDPAVFALAAAAAVAAVRVALVLAPHNHLVQMGIVGRSEAQNYNLAGLGADLAVEVVAASLEAIVETDEAGYFDVAEDQVGIVVAGKIARTHERCCIEVDR